MSGVDCRETSAGISGGGSDNDDERELRAVAGEEWRVTVGCWSGCTGVIGPDCVGFEAAVAVTVSEDGLVDSKRLTSMASESSSAYADSVCHSSLAVFSI